MFKSGYKIIFIKDGKVDLKQINLRPSHIIISLISFSFVLISSTILLSDNFSNWIGYKEIQKHKRNNEILVETINQNQLSLEQLNKELSILKEQDDLFRKLVKLPKIHEDVRRLGVGGDKSNKKSIDLNYLIPENIKYENINDDIDYLKRLMNLEMLSYNQTIAEAKKRKEYYRSYPAVRPVSLKQSKKSSGFGFRRDPFTRKHKFHDGDDFSARRGTPVYATGDGKVIKSKYYGTFGNYIEIRHGNGYKTIYAHLNNRKVSVGDRVIRGQQIGTVGNTGKSTAPHLHYEVSYKNKSQNPIDYYFDTPSVN